MEIWATKGLWAAQKANVWWSMEMTHLQAATQKGKGKLGVHFFCFLPCCKDVFLLSLFHTAREAFSLIFASFLQAWKRLEWRLTIVGSKDQKTIIVKENWLEVKITTSWASPTFLTFQSAFQRRSHRILLYAENNEDIRSTWVFDTTPLSLMRA